MDNNAQMMYAYLRDVIYSPDEAHLDIEKLDEGFQELGRGLIYFGESVTEVQNLARALSRGNLSCPVPSRENELAAPLKALHASLQHLTWQTQQVAKGDYQQRVDFMGEFSEAFNLMIKQLDDRQKALLTTIKEEQQQVLRLENYAYRDGLTGLYNRLYGIRRLEDWVDDHKAFCLCFVDMDNLKYVNDTFGHPEGDRYIISMASHMKEFSEDALLCRLGGDEFMLLIENYTFAEAKQRLEEIRKRIVEEKNPKYVQSISYGIVETDRHNKIKGGDLLSIADERMYEFKRAHKEERRQYIDDRDPFVPSRKE